MCARAPAGVVTLALCPRGLITATLLCADLRLAVVCPSLTPHAWRTARALTRYVGVRSKYVPTACVVHARHILSTLCGGKRCRCVARVVQAGGGIGCLVSHSPRTVCYSVRPCAAAAAAAAAAAGCVAGFHPASQGSAPLKLAWTYADVHSSTLWLAHPLVALFSCMEVLAFCGVCFEAEDGTPVLMACRCVKKDRKLLFHALLLSRRTAVCTTLFFIGRVCA